MRRLMKIRNENIAFFVPYFRNKIAKSPTMNHAAPTSVRIWDLPTRLFHWLFAASVIGAIATVKAGGLWMDWHLPFGVAALVLLVFRLIWGFVGPRYARFSHFVTSPKQLWRYLSATQTSHTAGHNPLGAWSVIALLVVVGIQAITGLFATDDILTQGPLNVYVSGQTASLMTTIHKWNETPLLILLGLHLLAILIYTLRGKNLVLPMITGNKSTQLLAKHTPNTRDDMILRAWALVLILALGTLGWWLVWLGQSAGFSF